MSNLAFAQRQVTTAFNISIVSTNLVRSRKYSDSSEVKSGFEQSWTNL